MNFNPRYSVYKEPFGAVKCGEKVHVRFPLADWVPVDRVLFFLRKEDSSTSFEMSYAGREDGYNVYELTYKVEVEGIYYYRFEMHNSSGVWYYGRGENYECVCGENLPEWQLTVYNSDYKTPDFAKGGVIYHIFADRFNKGKAVKTARNYRLHKSWSEEPETVSPDGKYYADDFFGGNLSGIEQKLDYLTSLGVTIIYLSPIFEAFSNHRYDTGDYLKIDSLLGTEADFKRLIDKAAKKGISIILDGVFNHSGADSRYFNKFGRYDSVGAFQSKQSPFYDWYYFKDYPNKYACWWGCDNVPDLNKSNEGYRNLIFGAGGVIDKWTSLGVMGWRLDVVDELPIDFTYKLCETVKNKNRDALIIGEVWEDASTKVSYSELRPYLLGRQLDSVMNYPFKAAVIDYVLGGDSRQFYDRVITILENYPRESVDCLMNIIGTHDTVRIINALSGVDAYGKSKTEKLGIKLTAEQYNTAKNRLKIASALQFTLPGIPSIYYGDEAGLQGFEDPINRRPFPWDNIDEELLAHYRALGRLRQENRDVYAGAIELIRADELLIYKRVGKSAEILTVVNNGAAIVEHTFDKDYIDIINNVKYLKGVCYGFAGNSFAIMKG